MAESAHNPSLDEFLGALPPEELDRYAGALAAMLDSEGWRIYRRLLRIQTRKAEFQMTARPLRDVQTYSHAGGHIAGLRQGLAIVDKVLELNAKVRERLEDEAAEHDAREA